MRIEEGIKLDFCDVLIKPKRSESPSRKAVNLKRYYTFKHSKMSWEGLPIIAANMATTGTVDMANALREEHAMTALHKHYDIKQLVNHFKHFQYNTWYTIGIKDEDLKKLEIVIDQTGRYIPFLNIDVANGYTNFFVEKVNQLRNLYPSATIMAGNVCTGEMVHELILAGADIVKVGIGPGSVCLTRVKAGVGLPQLSAIIECSDVAHGLKGHICADGGCTSPGDVAKSFGAGADFTMLGGMFSSTDECEGEWNFNQNGEKISMSFYGMSSKEAMDEFGGWSEYKTSEGKCVEVKYKGSAQSVLQDITGGLRSACTYVGTEELKSFSKCCTFIRVNRTHNTVYS